MILIVPVWIYLSGDRDRDRNSLPPVVSPAALPLSSRDYRATERLATRRSPPLAVPTAEAGKAVATGKDRTDGPPLPFFFSFFWVEIPRETPATRTETHSGGIQLFNPQILVFFRPNGSLEVSDVVTRRRREATANRSSTE